MIVINTVKLKSPLCFITKSEGTQGDNERKKGEKRKTKKITRISVLPAPLSHIHDSVNTFSREHTFYTNVRRQHDCTSIL